MLAKCLWTFETKENDDLFSHNDLTNGNEQLEAKSDWLLLECENFTQVNLLKWALNSGLEHLLIKELLFKSSHKFDTIQK